MINSAEDINWILWSGSVGLEKPVDDRVQAALAADFTRISVSPLDLQIVEAEGRSPKELGRSIRDQGLEIVMDPVMTWHPFSGTTGSRFGSFSVEQCMRWIDALGAVSLTAVSMAESDVPVEGMTEPFADLCDQAAQVGALVHLEFVPMTFVSTLAIAWDMVRDAARLNGGIVFDTWHFFRGDPDYSLLASIPGDRIFGVQIDDALAEPRESMRDDTVNRLLPGDGTFDLTTVIRALADIGALTWVGPEVISPVLEAMPAVEAARLAADRTRRVVAEALNTR
jgi:sugar phosphate isomerase/epimerase